MTTVQTNSVSQSLMDTMNPKAASATSTAEDAQNRFMTLLVTQMKNQDPLNPLDNAEVTSQLAQLSTVTGVDKLNTTLESLMGSYQASQSMQAASMIGHGVLVPGAGVELGSSGSAYMGVNLNAPVDSLTVNVRDSSGKIVDTMEAGSHGAGISVLQWDGKTSDGDTAPAGSYTFDISALSAGQKVASSAITSLSFGSVNSVSTSSQGVKLNVSGVGSVDMSDVQQIL